MCISHALQNNYLRTSCDNKYSEQNESGIKIASLRAIGKSEENYGVLATRKPIP